MSSPIHHAEDLDAAVMYAPPWARETTLSPSGLTGAPLRPASPSARRDDRWLEFSGDRAILEMRRQLALDPSEVPEPPLDAAQSLWPLALRLCGVMAAAALVAWGMVSLPGVHKAAHPHPPDNPAQTAAAAPPPVDSVNRVKLVHYQALPEPQPAGQGAFVTMIKQPLPPTGLDSSAPPPSSQPGEDAVTQPPSSPWGEDAVALDDDEIAVLIKRGQALLDTGDIVSARLLLRRAASAGSADAALALAASYDPQVIAKLHVIGIQPDTARARQWYATAARLGSAAAAQHLATLEGKP